MPPTYIAGYDASPESRAAVELAARLAEPAGAQVVAVNAYPFSSATRWIGIEGFLPEDVDADLRKQAEAVLDGLDVPGVERVAVQADSPARGLHDRAEGAGAELIVVGTTHHGPLGRLTAGSVGMHLLHGAPCPVGVVPAECGDRPVEAIGVAFDGRAESRAALDHADALARRLGARLTVVGAIQPVVTAVAMAGAYVPPSAIEDAERAFKSMLDEAAAGTQSGADVEMITGPATASLIGATADLDLLVTGSRGYGAVSGVLLGSVSRHLVDHAKCPVMVVPRPPAQD